MIVEDEKEEATIHIELNEQPGASFALPPEVNIGGNLCFTDVMRRKAAIVLNHNIPNFKMIWLSTFGIGLEIGIKINHW